jgi:O-antigen/teichoic acid export membrane protein
MILFSNKIYTVWVGKKVASLIPISLSVICAFYALIFNCNNITAYFLNGVGKIRLQLYVALIQVVVYIPLSLFMGKRYGIIGVISALCMVSLLIAIIQPVQCYKIINKKDKGIWGK